MSAISEYPIYLVTKGVAANDNGLLPGRNQAGDVLHDDWLAEDGAIENIADCAIGRLPHLLEVELCMATGSAVITMHGNGYWLLYAHGNEGSG